MRERIVLAMGINRRKIIRSLTLHGAIDFTEVHYETMKVYEFCMKGILGGMVFEWLQMPYGYCRMF